MGWSFNPFTGKFDYFRSIIPATDVEVSELGTATYDDVQDYINFFGDRTILSGGSITATSPADGTVIIAACKAWCKETDADTAIGKFFDYAGTTGVTLTDLTANIIYLDYNGGTPQVVVATAPATHGFKQDHILIGAVYRYGNETHIVQSDLLGIQGINRNHMHLVEHAGPHRSSGMVTSSTGTRNLSVTEGVFYLGLTRLISSSFDTSGTDTFSYWYYDGDAGPAVWVEVTGATQISRTQYNALATGLANLGTNRYGVHWVYLDIHGEHLHVVYGQGNYTANQAEIASVPSSLPGIATTFSVLIAKIICQEGTDVLTITYPWTTVFTSSLATDHGSLAGLTDDDHALYIKDSEFTAADEIIVGTGSGTFGQVTLAASQFLAKKAAGAATNVTAAEARTILNVADGADVTGDNAPQAHDIGGASHNADTWANLKGKISDITNVTAAELEYVTGVTSAIQTQLNGKASTAHGAAQHTDVTREIFLSVGQAQVEAGVLTDDGITGGANADEPIFTVWMKVPTDFVSFTKVEAFWYAFTNPVANMYWKLAAIYGACGEVPWTHIDTPAIGVTTLGGNGIRNCQESADPLTLSDLAVGDTIKLTFTRHGSHGDDTLEVEPRLEGLNFVYVGHQ